jgi:hypothetical protein
MACVETNADHREITTAGTSQQKHTGFLNCSFSPMPGPAGAVAVFFFGLGVGALPPRARTIRWTSRATDCTSASWG